LPATNWADMTMSVPEVRVLLVIDDDREFLKSLETILSRKTARQPGVGVRLLHTKATTDVLPALAETDVGAVVADLRMPGRSGMDVLSHARQINPTLRLSLLSGFDLTAEERTHADELGVEVLSKDRMDDALHHLRNVMLTLRADSPSIGLSIEKEKKPLQLLDAMLNENVLLSVDTLAPELTALRVAMKSVSEYLHPREAGDPMGAPTDDDEVLRRYRSFALSAKCEGAPKRFRQFAAVTVAALDSLLRQAAVTDRAAAATIYDTNFQPLLDRLEAYVNEHLERDHALLQQRIADFYRTIRQSPEP
jgi:ActR/RegA family two-component response regulator